MYNLQINELTPGQKYYVKVRAKAPGYATSEWSPVFEFEAEQDQIPPERVRNLEFTSEGESFIARWQSPELNMDGTPCTDLSHYTITLVNADASRTAHLETSTPELIIDLNSNRQLFGTPSGIIEITVSAVDRVGNVGPGTSKIAQNMPPAKVENVTAEASVETVNLKWDASAETDIEKYNVYVSNEGADFAISAAALRGSVGVGTTTFSYTTTSLSPLYFKVTAVDKFGQESPASDAAMAQPKLTTDFDKTPPGLIEDLTVTQTLADDQASAIARLSFSAAPDDDLDKYEVEYRKTGESILPWSFLNIPSDQTSAEIKPLPLSTSYDFRVRAVDFLANKGAWSPVVVAPGVKKTTLPAAPTDITAHGGMSNLMVAWTESTDPSMANWAGVYEVQVAKTLGFTDPIVVRTSSTLASLTNLEKNSIYHVRVRSIDPYGNIGPWSVAASENTGEVAESGNRSIFDDSDATGVSQDGVPFKNGDIWYKTDADNSILAMWEFFDGNWIPKEVKNLAEDSVTSETISADAILARHIKAEEITGDKLAANAAVINNLKIQSSIEINDANGHIKSSNYTSGGTAGFYMDQQQLIINQGKISAAALQIQDSQNILPPVFAGLNYKSEYYENSISPENGATFYHFPNAGRNADGAILHVGRHTRLLLTSADITGFFALTAGEKYIVSGYARALTMLSSGTISPINVSLGVFAGNLYNEDSIEVHGSPKVVTDTFTPQRVQMVFTAPFDGLGAIYLNQHDTENNAPLGPEDGVLWSGLQVERVVAGNEVASPWSPPGHTIISGESITTGAISSNSTISTPNGDIARWSIDTNGNARFADATIDGKLVVGADVSNKEATSIQSDTYAPGLAGWAIKGNGDVEFNDGTFRGTLNLEKAGLNDIDLSMTASVSEVKLYVNETDSRPINAASIQGVTYAFDRQEVEGSGVFLPTIPDKEKIGRYYIGPTTDRSVNIQVHEGPEENAVYLDRPPVDVALTSLRVGEITTPSSEPMSREKQGVSFDAIRVEEDPDDPTLQSTTAVSQTSTVQLRSPYYPEEDRGGEYPESRHVLESVVDFTAPSGKNLIDPIYSLPTVDAPGMTARRGRNDYDGRAYPLLNGAASLSRDFVLAESISVGKKYILSIYVDTLDATGDTTFYGMFRSQGGAGMHMTPLGDHRRSSNNLGIVIESGQESVRIAYSFTPTTISDQLVGISVSGTAGSTVYGFKVQLEEASYQSNMSLPEEIRSKTAPTPWTINGAKSSSSASLTLKAEPAPDYNSWASSSIVGYQAHTPGAQDVGKRDLPTSMELNLSSSYTYSGGGSSRSIVDATYKWGTAGMVYPGAKSAFLPAAADIYWDFTQSSPLEKPTLGDGTGIRTINDGPWGAINLQGGVYLEDRFNRNSFGNAWGSRGVVTMTLDGSDVNRNQSYDAFPKDRPRTFVFHNEPLATHNYQLMTFRVRNYRYGLFGVSARSVNVSAIINYNPNNDDGLYLRIEAAASTNATAGRIWKLYSYKNGTETLLRSGTYSHDWGNNSWHDLVFERNGNRVKCTYLGSILFEQTFTEAQLPDGKHVGFNLDTGQLDIFRAYDNLPSSSAYGRLESQSFNINNNRGIDVAANGTVKIASPGFYMMTADITATFNARANESYWIYVDEVIPGLGTTVHSLSGNPGWGALNITGTAVAYLQGELFLRVRTNAQDRRTLDHVNWTIVRVA